MKTKYIIPIMLLTFTFISAQSSIRDNSSAFVSGLFGAAQYGSPSYTKNSSSLAITGGGDFGIPLFQNVHFINKISYHSISDYETYLSTSNFETNLGVVHELVKTNASFSHLILSSGLQYTFSVYEGYKIGLSAGMQYSLINQDAYLTNGTLVRQLNNEGFFGYFGGILAEKTFKDENYSIIGEAQYNYIESDAVSYTDEFSGMNFFLGGRYYFNAHRI